MKKLLALALGAVLMFSACKKDEEEAPTEYPVLPKVLISCEGGFNASNASISTYEIDSKTTVNNAFEDANGFMLGDILQSLYTQDDKVYAVMNNSNKIEVMDLNTLSSEGTIEGTGFSRYMSDAQGSLAYASDLFGDMHILDLESQETFNVIPTQGNTTGEIKTVDDKAFVCFESADFVRVINTQSHLTSSDIVVGRTPVAIEEDAEGMLWVMSTGFWYDADNNWEPVQDDAKLTRIDPANETVLMSVDFDDDSGLFDIEMLPDGLSFYLIHQNDVKVVDCLTGEVSVAEDFDLEGPFYGKIGVDPANADLYISEYGDFSSPGTVQRYRTDGTLRDEITTGIAPNGFIFRY